MEFDWVYTTEEVATILKCHPNAVRSMEDKGILHRLPYVPGVKFSGLEIAQLIGKDYNLLKLQNEVKALRNENKDLKDRMARIGILTNMGARIQ